MVVQSREGAGLFKATSSPVASSSQHYFLNQAYLEIILYLWPYLENVYYVGYVASVQKLKLIGSISYDMVTRAGHLVFSCNVSAKKHITWYRKVTNIAKALVKVLPQF